MGNGPDINQHQPNIAIIKLPSLVNNLENRLSWLTSKIIIDATRQWPNEGGPENWPPASRELLEEKSPETFALVAERWQDYWKGWNK